MGKNAAIKITFGLEDQEPQGRSLLDQVGYASLSSLINIGIVEAKQFFERRALERRVLEQMRQAQQVAHDFRSFESPAKPQKFEVRAPFLVAVYPDGTEVKVAVADEMGGVPCWAPLVCGGMVLSMAQATGVPIPNPPAAAKPGAGGEEPQGVAVAGTVDPPPAQR